MKQTIALVLTLFVLAIPALAEEAPYSAPPTSTIASTSPEPPSVRAKKFIDYYYKESFLPTNSPDRAARIGDSVQISLMGVIVEQNAALMEQNNRIIALLEQIAKK